MLPEASLHFLFISSQVQLGGVRDRGQMSVTVTVFRRQDPPNSTHQSGRLPEASGAPGPTF